MLYAKRELSKNQDKTLKKIDKKIGYSTNKYRKDFDNIISEYGRTTSQIKIEDRVNSFRNLFDGKKLGAIDEFPIMRKYARNFFGNQTNVLLFYKDNNVMSIIPVSLDDGEKIWLYKINSSDIAVTQDYKNLIKGWDAQ